MTGITPYYLTCSLVPRPRGKTETDFSVLPCGRGLGTRLSVHVAEMHNSVHVYRLVEDQDLEAGKLTSKALDAVSHIQHYLVKYTKSAP